MTTAYTETVHPQSGGILWQVKDEDLAIGDGGYALMSDFIKAHPHDDYTLSVYDSITESTIEINCPVAEMPRIVSYVYRLEHAAPLAFIGENPLSDSYVVGMRCTRGRLSIPGTYKAEDGRLIEIEEQETN